MIPGGGPRLAVGRARGPRAERRPRIAEGRGRRAEAESAEDGLTGLRFPARLYGPAFRATDRRAPPAGSRKDPGAFRGAFLTVRRAAGALRDAGGGAIVVTSSVNGPRLNGFLGAAAYNCAKEAQLRLEAARAGARAVRTAPPL